MQKIIGAIAGLSLIIETRERRVTFAQQMFIRYVFLLSRHQNRKKKKKKKGPKKNREERAMLLYSLTNRYWFSYESHAI
jgi:hypothetical protein